ncbi:unnamed protein product, partial [Mesorhabditis spiculigera]
MPKKSPAITEKATLAELEQLKAEIPLYRIVTKFTDKTSILRVATAYMLTKKFLGEHLGEFDGRVRSGIPDESTHSVMALDGFCMVIDRLGRLLYVTESAAALLGYSQIEVLGCEIEELVSQQGWQHIRQLLQYRGDGATFEVPFSMQIDMKCRLPKRHAGQLRDGKKPITIKGFVRFDGATRQRVEYLLLHCDTVETVGDPEMLLDNHSFVMRGFDVLRYPGGALLDRSIYELIPPEDVPPIEKAHRMLLAGQVHVNSLLIGLLTAGGGQCYVDIRFYAHGDPNRTPFTAICSVVGYHTQSTVSTLQSSLNYWPEAEEKNQLGCYSSQYYAKTFGPIF